MDGAALNGRAQKISPQPRKLIECLESAGKILQNPLARLSRAAERQSLPSRSRDGSATPTLRGVHASQLHSDETATHHVVRSYFLVVRRSPKLGGGAFQGFHNATFHLIDHLA